MLKEKLDKLFDERLWEPNDILPQMENNSESSSSRDCIIYYVCGNVTKQILKKKFINYIRFLKSGNNEHPAAELVRLKSKGNLMYLNTHLFNFLTFERARGRFLHRTFKNNRAHSL